jgi:hypothetical protein
MADRQRVTELDTRLMVAAESLERQPGKFKNLAFPHHVNFKRAGCCDGASVRAFCYECLRLDHIQCLVCIGHLRSIDFNLWNGFR